MACQWPSRPHNWPTQLHWLGQFGAEAANLLNFLPNTGPYDFILAWANLSCAMNQIGTLAISYQKPCNSSYEHDTKNGFHHSKDPLKIGFIALQIQESRELEFPLCQEHIRKSM